MENRNRPDTITLSAIIIGGASLLGLCLIVLMTQMYQPRPAVAQADTSTPFKYLFLGTEPGISTAEPPTEAPTVEETFDGTGTTVPETEAAPRHSLIVTARAGAYSSKDQSTSKSVTLSPTLLHTSTSSPMLTLTPVPTTATSPIIVVGNTSTFTAAPPSSGTPPTKTPTRTPRPTFTSANTATPTNTSPPGVLLVGKYDDFESRITYIGDWVVQTGISGAYQTTLHVSSTIGNALTFSFSGLQLVLSYQGGSSLGTVIVRIDNAQFELDQSIGDEWVSPILTTGTHTVYISHIAGGSVNLDAITIPDLATPTTGP